MSDATEPDAPTVIDSVADLLALRREDDGVGLRFGERSWTWREVVHECERRAAWLTETLDWSRPPHLGVLLDNVPEFVFLLGGAALSGAVVVGINPTRRGAELATDINHTDCQVVVTSSGYSGLLDGAGVTGLGVRGAVVSCESDEYQDELTRTRVWSAAQSAPTGDSLFILLFTSGSTGAPKAVRMSQRRAVQTAERSVFGADDALYCSMPVFHGNSLHACVFPSFRTGATLVLREKFSASAFVDDLRSYGATFFSTVGRALAYVLATPERPSDREHVVKFGLGPESSPADIREFRRRFGIYIVEGYGSSENAIIMAPSPDMPRGALGQPMDGNDVIVVDSATGMECPRAEIDANGLILNSGEAIGELVSRNAVSRFEGYYKNPEAEAERTRNGWYWSGDLAYRDHDGWFFFAGRNADWLRVDGENFSATPVERILARYAPFGGVCVFGVPDAVTGDQVMAAASMTEGQSFDPDDFAKFLATQRDLGTKWAPRFLRVVDELPLTATNKVAKLPLRAAGWETDDPMWWRAGRGADFRPMTAADRARIRSDFAEHGREQLLNLGGTP